MTKYHIQQSGKERGRYVPCHAIYECRNGGLHVNAETVANAKTWYTYTRKSYLIDQGVTIYLMNYFLSKNPDGQFTPPESYALELPDSTFLPDNRIRKGLNDPKKQSDLLKQLDLEGDEFRNSITEEERMALRTYCGHGYALINNYNREGRAGIIKYLKENYSAGVVDLNEETFSQYEDYAKRDVKELDAIFARYVRPNKNKRVLHRVVKISKEDTSDNAQTYVQKTYKIGDSITEKSYMSTTADSDYILSFGGREPENIIVYEILTDKGIPIHDPYTKPGSVEHSEREVLLNRGLTFKIVNITEAKYKTTYPEGKPTGHSAYMHAIPEQKYTVIQMVEEEQE